MRFFLRRKPCVHLALHVMAAELHAIVWEEAMDLSEAQVATIPFSDMASLAERLKRADLLRTFPLKLTSVDDLVVTVPDQLIIYKKCILPAAMTDSDIENYLALHAENYFGIASAAIYYDFFAMPLDQSSQEVWVYATKKEEVSPWAILAKNWALPLRGVHVQSLMIIVALKKIFGKENFIFLHHYSGRILLGLVLVGKLHYFREFNVTSENLSLEQQRLAAQGAGPDLPVFFSGEKIYAGVLKDFPNFILVDDCLPFSSKFLICIGMMEQVYAN